MSNTWVVRAGVGNMIAGDVEAKSAVAIGWKELGDCSTISARDQFREKYRLAYPDQSAPKVAVQSGQVFRFCTEIHEGDVVLTPIQATREVLMGVVSEPYRYDPSAIHPDYPHIRPVQWKQKISRDVMSKALRNTIGGTLTVFLVRGHRGEIAALLEAGKAAPAEVGEAELEEEVDFLAETEAKADDLISDILAHIDWQDFELLVAALLRAMGFRTRLSNRGPDGGYDIIAHPDEFGFETPRIRVEVKHRKQSMGSPEVRSFRATIGPEEHGLYVSTGDFTTDARRVPGQAGRPLTLVNRDEFIRLLCEYYEALEAEYQAMVPLKRVYIPPRV